jgi:PAS domain S-box-containing protein/putative nucleotidyltransferase with HDIG domain
MTEPNIESKNPRLDLQNLFGAAPVAVVVVRGEKKIFVNPSCLNLFGFADPEEFVSRPIIKQIAPQCRDQFLERMQKISSGETMADAYETTGQKFDGTQMPIRIETGKVELQDGPALAYYISDITEYRKAEEKIHHLASFPELSPIPIIEVNFAGKIVYHNQATQTVLSRLGLDDPAAFLPLDLANILTALEMTNQGTLYREVLVKDRIYAEDIFLALKFRTVRFYIYDVTERMWAQQELKKSEENYRELIDNLGEGVGISDLEERFIFTNPALDMIFGVKVGELTGRRLAEFVTPETMDAVRRQTDRRRRGERDSYEIDIRTPGGTPRQILVSATPKFQQGKFIGTLAIIHDITDRRQAIEELTQSYRKLNRAMDQTINALAATLGKRDPYTSSHQQRVTKLVMALSNQLNLTSDQAAGIRVASILHDIGKIYVPSEILSKPTSLTEAEFNIIKTHSQAGYEILQGVEFPWPIAQIVLQHHEKLDGSGYPNGLSNDKILYEAKIIMVADVVEALSSDRPYRPAFGIDAALKEIALNRGKFYEPTVVDACLEVFRQKTFKFD